MVVLRTRKVYSKTDEDNEPVNKEERHTDNETDVIEENGVESSLEESCEERDIELEEGLENSEAEQELQSDTVVATKKRRVSSSTYTVGNSCITSADEIDGSGSFLFFKLHRGLDSVNVMLRNIIGKISNGQKDIIFRELECVILRTAFFPNFHNWAEESQNELTNSLLQWDSSEASLDDILREFSQNILSTRLVLTLKDKLSKRFRTRFENFWKHLAKIAPPELIQGNSFFPFLIERLEQFTFSSYRNIRYVATLICFSLVNGFISSEESARSQHSLFELHATHSKSQQKHQRNSTNLTGIAGHMDKIFNKVFVLRYRDICPEIRALAISNLQEWILNLPRSFLDDRFLKYIGWMLNDKASEVRASSLEAVENLLKIQEHWQRMQLFLRRFRKRIAEMVQDKDVQVAKKAIHVLELIMQISGLTAEEKNILFQLFTSDNRKPVREVATTCIGQIVEQIAYNTLPDNPVSRNSSAAAEPVPVLIRIARFILDERLNEDFFSNCLDILLKEIPVLKNWDAYFSVLLCRVNASSGDNYSDNERLIIAKMLLKLTQHLSKSSSPESSSKLRTKRINQQISGQGSQFQELCRSVLSNMQTCLIHYQADARMLLSLVPLIRCIDFESVRIYCIPETFREIANELKEMVHKHTPNFPLLAQCFLALREMSQMQDISFQNESTAVLSQLRNDISDSLRSHLQHEAMNSKRLTEENPPSSSNSTIFVKALALTTYGWELPTDCVDLLVDFAKTVNVCVSSLRSEDNIVSFSRLMLVCLIQKWQKFAEQEKTFDCEELLQQVSVLVSFEEHAFRLMYFIDQPEKKLVFYTITINSIQLLCFTRYRSSKFENSQSAEPEFYNQTLKTLGEQLCIYFKDSFKELWRQETVKDNANDSLLQKEEYASLFHFFRCYTQVCEYEDFPPPYRHLPLSLLVLSDWNFRSLGRQWLKKANVEDIAGGLFQYLKHFYEEHKQLRMFSNELCNILLRGKQGNTVTAFVLHFLALSLSPEDSYRLPAEAIKEISEQILSPLIRNMTPKEAKHCYREMLRRIPQIQTSELGQMPFEDIVNTIKTISESELHKDDLHSSLNSGNDLGTDAITSNV
eukprot:jgi/Galph1/313/GphlegSOOS_G5020.1